MSFFAEFFYSGPDDSQMEAGVRKRLHTPVREFMLQLVYGSSIRPRGGKRIGRIEKISLPAWAERDIVEPPDSSGCYWACACLNKAL